MRKLSFFILVCLPLVAGYKGWALLNAEPFKIESPPTAVA